jgi:cysteinyl-tRNA synthetase
MSIKIHNTLTGQVEPLETAQPGLVRMYVCGITPYDACHLGHARCYVVFDMVRRVLRANGYAVRYVQNFTDVDDKIIARAAERGIPVAQLVQSNIDDFFNKMDALGIERADAYPRVTGHIPEILAMVGQLLDKKMAYRVGEDVYFSVRQFSGYGKLSKRPLAELESGARQTSGEARRYSAARVEVNPEKRDPLDFALWKASKPGEPPEVSWPAPWGKGRPGWHVECSAMALKHLGENFDIHGGGLDLVFPHHENEIAQSEAATGRPFARFWMHNGFVTVNKEKMSKSLGNFFTLEEIFAKYPPAVVRYMLLTVHYRSPLDFSPDLLEQSRHALSGLRDSMARASFVLQQHANKNNPDPPVQDIVSEADRAHRRFLEALSEDFNTPAALAEIHAMAQLLEKASFAISVGSIRAVLEKLRQAADVLGLQLFTHTPDIQIPAEVAELAHEREAARQSKNWKEADRLRKVIEDKGYSVEDTAQGPRVMPKIS